MSFDITRESCSLANGSPPTLATYLGTVCVLVIFSFFLTLATYLVTVCVLVMWYGSLSHRAQLQVVFGIPSSTVVVSSIPFSFVVNLPSQMSLV